MKLCLVSTPFLGTSYIPYNLALLKGQITNKFPSLEVKNMDFNISFFNEIFNNGSSAVCDKCVSTSTACIPPENLCNRNGFKTLLKPFKHKIASKHDYDKMIKHSMLLNAYILTLKNCYTANISAYVFEDRLPTICDETLRQDVKKIIKEKPDLCGFSIFSTENMLYALALAKMLKKETNIPVIFGGSLMNYLDIDHLLTKHTFIDFACLGDGAECLVQLIRSIGTRRFSHIPNLYYRSQGRIKSNDRKFGDLTDVSPDFSDFNLKAYYIPEKALPIMSSSGCYWRKCAYCRHHEVYRVRNIDSVIKEIKYQKSKNNVRKFFFIDTAISPVRLRAISEALIKNKVNIKYAVWGLRPEPGLSYNLLKKAYDSGLRLVFTGVETTNQRLLDKFERGTQVKIAERIIDDCYSIGIMPHMFFMFGFPTETEKELSKDILFISKHLQHCNISSAPFTLAKCTPLYNNPSKYGITIKEDKAQEPSFVVKKGVNPGIARIYASLFFGNKHIVINNVIDFILSCSPYRMAPIKINLPKIVGDQIKTNIRNIKNTKEFSAGYRYFILGQCLMALNKYRSAQKMFKKAGRSKFSARFLKKLDLLHKMSFDNIKGQLKKTA